MTLDINDLIAKMEQARSQLNSAVDKVAPQIDIYPTWKIKQLLDHIAGWDELMISAYQAYAKGESPVSIKHGIDEYNAESVSNRKALSLGQSRQKYDAARQKVIQVMREMPADKLTERLPAPWGGMCTVASVVKIFVSHELEHAAQIEQILTQASTSG